MARQPKPVTAMQVFRTGPPAASFEDLGTVVVTCPTVARAVDGALYSYGGCDYAWATWKAAERAAAGGADGIHSIESSTNSSGATVSLKASAFIYIAVPATAAAAPAPSVPTTEERLKQLDKLKADKLITPDEYTAKRAEILKGL